MSKVDLDYTLADLYAQDADASNLVAVFAYPSPRGQGTSASPLSKKYTYQTPLASSATGDAVERRRLQYGPLKMTFTAGKMPVVFFDLDPNGNKPNGESTHHLEAAEVLNQLNPDQKPDLIFVPGPEDLKLPTKSEIVVLNPLDRIDHFTHAIDPEVHYSLLSKRGLALSGLPTPQTTVIDSSPIPYEGWSSEALEDEVDRMINPICTRDLPFIVKVPQAAGGLGTFILHTEYQRQATGKVLREEVRSMLESVSSLNEHLYTCCLVLQEILPGEVMPLSMFVTQRGRSVFIGCCTQAQDKMGFWVGGRMSYPQQSELEARFADVMNKVASFLHGKGYYGPVGIDIMIDGEGRHYVIDLNARVAGSYALGCLRGHFQRLGLLEALLHSFSARCSHKDFKTHFQHEFDEGRFVMISWTSGFPGGLSSALVCMAAPNQSQLEHDVSRVDSFLSDLPE
jgi:hypothetical protein